MKNPIIPTAFAEQSNVPSGKLSEALLAYKLDQQTGMVELDIPGEVSQILLFARGQLVNVYSANNTSDRIDPNGWLELLNGSKSAAQWNNPGTLLGLRMLALTPQDVRIFKILIEQKCDNRGIPKSALNLEKQVESWMEHPVPALAQVRWPRAEALLLFPGLGAPPCYSLFITGDQILHSAGGVSEIYGWVETPIELRLFSCEPLTTAWTEYLLHYAFSNLVSNLLKKFEKLIGRIMLNQIIREVNFKATAHDWNLSINVSGVNDQIVFTSPASAAEVYSRLLEVIFHQFEGVLGNTMLEMLVREATYRLPVPARQVVNEFLPVTNLG